RTRAVQRLDAGDVVAAQRTEVVVAGADGGVHRGRVPGRVDEVRVIEAQAVTELVRRDIFDVVGTGAPRAAGGEDATAIPEDHIAVDDVVGVVPPRLVGGGGAVVVGLPE